jgi:TolB protein
MKLAAFAIAVWLITACSSTNVRPPEMQIVPTEKPTTTSTPTATFPSTFVRPTLPPTWTPTPTFTPTGEVTYTLTPTDTVTPAGTPIPLPTLPAFSRNTIAFTAWEQIKNKVVFKLIVYDFDSGTQIQLINDRSIKSNPVWSPDGSQLVYESQPYTGGNKQDLVLIRLDNRVRLPLTTGQMGARYPAFSPDGTRIAYVSRVTDEADTELFIMNADGKQVTRLTDNLLDETAPSWSSDGRQIVFGQPVDQNTVHPRTDIFIMDVATGTTRQIGSASGRIPVDLAWSPDGRQIAFVSDQDIPGRPNIYVMNADGSNVRRLTTSLKQDTHPSWSPDSQQIVYYNWDDTIIVMNADGSNPRPLPIKGSRPSWRPG